jgi:hypothetical protein
MSFIKPRGLRAPMAAGILLLAFPAAGLAATTAESDTSATIGSELSVVAPATTNLSTLTHGTAATGSTVVDVTSTTASWSLTATDEASADAGHLVSGGTTLDEPLEVTSGATTGDLTGSGVSVSGALVASKTFNFSQSLGATEGVQAGDSYALTVTYTVTDTDI